MIEGGKPVTDEILAEREKFIHQWGLGLRIKHIAHSLCFAMYSSQSRLIGLAAAILSALVSTAVIVSFTKSDDTVLKIIAGGFSVLAALFAAANTFLKLGDLAAKHNHAMVSYGQLRRKLEFAECWEKDLNTDFMKRLLTEWNDLDKSAPAIPNKIYEKASIQAEAQPL